MRDTVHFKKHLSIRTHVFGEKIDDVPVEDPFHNTRITVCLAFWEWFSLLFKKRQIPVQVRVIADGCAVGRWFQGADICEKCCRARLNGNDKSPGYHSHGMLVCEECYYGSWEEQPKSVGCVGEVYATEFGFVSIPAV